MANDYFRISASPTCRGISTYDGSGEWVKIYTLGLTLDPTHETNP